MSDMTEFWAAAPAGSEEGLPDSWDHLHRCDASSTSHRGVARKYLGPSYLYQ